MDSVGRLVGGLMVSCGLLWAALAAPEAARANPETGGPSVYYYSFFNGWPRDAYVLDPVPRFLEEEPGRRRRRPRMRCDTENIVRHHSTAPRYTVRVHSAFSERLTRFEELLNRVATEHYGRPPRRLVHRGAFACRNARGRRGRISEHAFGNALDMQGLDFRPLPRGTEPPPDLPRHLRRGFSLRVLSHWSPRRARDAYHAQFLHRLAEELRARPDIFRGIVGPPRPRHRDHLHLDAAPWRYAMFGYEP